jgi:hypothetical protein
MVFYEHWLFGLERLLVEHGFLSAEELERARRAHPVPARGRSPHLRERALRKEEVQRVLQDRRGARLDERVAAGFDRLDGVVRGVAYSGSHGLAPPRDTRAPRRPSSSLWRCPARGRNTSVEAMRPRQAWWQPWRSVCRPLWRNRVDSSVIPHAPICPCWSAICWSVEMTSLIPLRRALNRHGQ